MGVTIHNPDGTIQSSVGSLPEGTAGDVELANKYRFVLARPLHLTAAGKVVEEDDPAGVKVLGGKGSVISPADVEKYGLNDSHRLSSPGVVAEAPQPQPEPVPEPVTEPVLPPAPEPEAVPEPEPEAKPVARRGRK